VYATHLFSIQVCEVIKRDVSQPEAMVTKVCVKCILQYVLEIFLQFTLRAYRTPSNLLKGMAKLISQQPENWENGNGPDLVQAFPKKW
jgi:hypothetical protein